MRRRVVFAVAVLVAESAGGCGFFKPPQMSAKPDGSPRAEKGFRKAQNPPSRPAQEAVYAVLDDDKQRFKAGFDALTPNAGPSAAVKFLQEYCDALDKADLAACPADFKGAFLAYLKACKKVKTALTRLPDAAFPESEFMTAFVGILRGNTDLGKPLGGDVTKAIEAMNKAFGKLYDAAGPAGIDFDR